MPGPSLASPLLRMFALVRGINAMPTILVPYGITCEMIYTQGSQRLENVYWVTKGTVPIAADLTALWTLFRDWENTSGKTQRMSPVSCVLISLASRHAVGAPVYEAAVSPVIAGSQPAAVAPPFNTMAVRHSTGLSGRSYRGRTYHIGMAQVWNDGDGLVTAVVANAIAACYNLLRTNLATAGWTLCVASLYSGVEMVNGYRRGIPRAAGILTPILTSTCERGIDTRRSRKIPQQF